MHCTYGQNWWLKKTKKSFLSWERTYNVQCITSFISLSKPTAWQLIDSRVIASIPHRLPTDRVQKFRGLVFRKRAVVFKSSNLRPSFANWQSGCTIWARVVQVNANLKTVVLWFDDIIRSNISLAFLKLLLSQLLHSNCFWYPHISGHERSCFNPGCQNCEEQENEEVSK